MSTYVSLISYTDLGIRTIKNSPERLDAVRNLAGSFGGELKDFYLTFGEYDIVLVSQFPDDAASARFILMLGSLGNVRSTTLKAFPEAEYREIIESLP